MLEGHDEFNHWLGEFMRPFADQRIVVRVFDNFNNDYDIVPHDQTAELLEANIQRYADRLRELSIQKDEGIVRTRLDTECKLKWTKDLVGGVRARLSEVLGTFVTGRRTIVEAFLVVAADNANRQDLIVRSEN